MAVMPYFLVGIIALMGVGAAFLYVLHRRSYKNKVHIARQTGNSVDDVVWFEDKFRVVNKDGAWRIEFQKLKEGTRSIEGKLWTKFVRGANQKKVLRIPKEKWEAFDMRKHIMRGLYLYETNEGEYYPMTIRRETGVGGFLFSVLDQDNRQFVITETQGVNDLTRDRKREHTQLLAIIAGLCVFGVVAVAAMWWMSRMHDQNVMQTAQICSTVAKNVVQGVNSSSFLGDILGG